MSTVNSYAPFNESNQVLSQFNEDGDYTLTNRTFEEVITERENLNTYNTYNTCNTCNTYNTYNTIFEKIKIKLFQMNIDTGIDISDCPIINKYRDDFQELKKNVCDIYLDYMESECELNKAKEKYKTFCEGIKNCIYFINNTGTVDKNDITIKKLLEEKIENYYEKLNINNLIKKFDEKRLEFEKTKYKISTIAGCILPTTICQICLENQVEYFIDPCGHTICKTCKTIYENKSEYCHYCRTKKNVYKRVYTYKKFN
jgi:hypothetical protein